MINVIFWVNRMIALHCCETSDNEITAVVDETLLQDRVLKNMLKTEDRYTPTCYSSANINIQREITDQMIGIVGEWMMEVSFLL